MTPGGQAQAVIEILDQYERTGRAPDRLLAEWLRAHRFAGSKDRRAISDLFYGVLRSRAALEWRLGQAGAGEKTARLLLFAHVGAEATAAWVGQGAYAPAALSADEAMVLQTLPPQESAMPLWARFNFAPWIEPFFRRAFPNELEAELAALQTRAPVDLRVYGPRTHRTTIINQLRADGILAEEISHTSMGIRLPPGQYDLRAYAGRVEPQDESAQRCALALDARPGDTVIDLCAGGGGKTLALMDIMQDQGALHAFDADPKRLARLRKRAVLHAPTSLHIHDRDGPAALGRLVGQADRVLVDAPCSGTGVWRRHPGAGFRLTQDQFERDCAAQAALLDQARHLLRPGGRLIYATCSLLREENQNQIEAFLKRAPEIHFIEETQLSPYLNGCDGFYYAVMEKKP